MKSIYLLLGSNIGKRRATLTSAEKKIEQHIGLIKRKSSFYESEPWGFEGDNNFLNRVLIVQSDKEPGEILKYIKIIETELGRKRSSGPGYTSRTIDIDILFYDDWVYETPDLIIPHPLLQERRFTMLPLDEVSPDFVHPGYKKTIREILNECPDQSPVNRLDS
jgi:2-amino-4-hydroxy-6-hydroxymethyldihydropteridine diphosphokinase